MGKIVRENGAILAIFLGALGSVECASTCSCTVPATSPPTTGARNALGAGGDWHRCADGTNQRRLLAFHSSSRSFLPAARREGKAPKLKLRTHNPTSPLKLKTEY